MKKPKKPKAKRPSASIVARGTPQRAKGAAALGPAASAFLQKSSKPTSRPAPKASKSSGPAPGAGSGSFALGPAARAFLASNGPRAALPSAVARTVPFDQREIATLFLLPLCLLAMAFGLNQTWRHPFGTTDDAPPHQTSGRTAAYETLPPPATDIVKPALSRPGAAPTARVPDVRQASLDKPVQPSVRNPEVELRTPVPNFPRTAPAIEVPEVRTPAIALSVRPPAIDVPVLVTPALAMPSAAPSVPAPAIAAADPALRLPPGPPEPEKPEPDRTLALATPIPSLPTPSATITPAPKSICLAEPGFGEHRYEVRAVAPGESFGDRLAEAARAQTREFVIYNDAYRHISFPMGDVPPLFGVCTDVIIRAYRALGIDLQALVHAARVGSGDTNIDHRRTETLRRFFAGRGQSLPISSFPEDYQPGDIVTYYRPQNRHTRSHIAIVSDQLAPSGRPMIVHNRGWGPQLEDALFVDQITGHYRFHPGDNPIVAVAQKPAKLVTLRRPTQSTARMAQRQVDAAPAARAVSTSQ